MKRVPWRSTGLPYWKGIYSASYPVGKMRSTASPTAKLSCGTNSTVPPTVIAVNTTTVTVSMTIRLSDIDFLYEDSAAEFLEALQVALVRNLITAAFKPLIQSVRVLSMVPDDASVNAVGISDILLDVVYTVLPGKAPDAAQFCIAALPRVTEEVKGRGEL